MYIEIIKKAQMQHIVRATTYKYIIIIIITYVLISDLEWDKKCGL